MQRILQRLAILLLLSSFVSGCSLAGPTIQVFYRLTSHPTVAQPAALATQPATLPAVEAVGSELPQLLASIPNTPAYRAYLSFGDVAAWYDATAMPRVNSITEWEALDQPERDLWSFALTAQTIPPEVLGLRYAMAEDMRARYGFSFFDATRFLESGMPPANVTVLQTSADPAQIASALLALGYSASPVEGGTLYSIRDDNEIALDSPSRVGQLGQLNRIVLLGDTLIIGRATDVVMRALDSLHGDTAALAADPIYRALTGALSAPAVAPFGELVGAILIGQPLADDPLVLLDRTNEAIQAQLDAYTEATLPLYLALGFATQRLGDESYLTLAVVFPPGVDGAAVAAILGDRLANYTSMVINGPLTDYWSFAQQTSVEVEGLPVALVTMHVAGKDERGAVRPRPFTWSNLVFQRDLLFLLSGTPVRP